MADETEHYESGKGRERISVPLIDQSLCPKTINLTVNYFSGNCYLTDKGIYDLARNKERLLNTKGKLEELVNRKGTDPSKSQIPDIKSGEIEWVKQEDTYLKDLNKVICKNNPELYFYHYYEIKVKNEEEAKLLAHLFKDSQNLAFNKEKKGQFILHHLSGNWIKALQSQKENMKKSIPDCLHMSEKIIEKYNHSLKVQESIIQDFGELSNPGYTFRVEEILLKKIPEGKK